MRSNELYDDVRHLLAHDGDALFERASYPTPLLAHLRAAGRIRESPDIAAIRDAPLPDRRADDGDPDRQRQMAMTYMAMIEPHLPRAGRVR
jgi:hypothetical protein